jgi:hypothetical protein
MAGFRGAQPHLDHVVRIELARYSDGEHSRVNSSLIHSIRNFLPLRVRSSTKSSVQTWSGHSGGKRTHDPRPARAASASAGAPAPSTPPAAVESAALDHPTWPSAARPCPTPPFSREAGTTCVATWASGRRPPNRPPTAPRHSPRNVSAKRPAHAASGQRKAAVSRQAGVPSGRRPPWAARTRFGAGERCRRSMSR